MASCMLCVTGSIDTLYWKQQTQFYQITNSNTQNGKQCHRIFMAQTICKLRIQEVLRTLQVQTSSISSNTGNECKNWAWM